MADDNPSLAAIFGAHDAAGLVAAEHLAGKSGQDEILLFVRTNTGTEQVREPFSPFLWLEDKSLLGDAEGCDVQTLSGRNPLKVLVRFRSWKAFQKFVTALKSETGRNPSDPTAPFFLLNDPIQQHLLATGRTLFKGSGGGNWVHSAWALNGAVVTVAATPAESSILPAN